MPIVYDHEEYYAQINELCHYQSAETVDIEAKMPAQGEVITTTTEASRNKGGKMISAEPKRLH